MEDHAGSRNCGELLLDKYRVAATGGSSGQRGVFVYDRDSWEIVNGTLRRWHQVSGAPPSPRVVGIGAPSPVHLSNRFCAEIRGINTKAPRLSVVTPIEEIVEALNSYQPQILSGAWRRNRSRAVSKFRQLRCAPSQKLSRRMCGRSLGLPGTFRS